MPATAGRVRMPANNRVHSSAALQTHGIWQSAIGYDPYAPTNKEDSKNSSQSKSLNSEEPEGENAYANFQGLLALARITNSNSDEARGACKKCGRVGHLTFQCRNFLSVKEDLNGNGKDEDLIKEVVLEKLKGEKVKSNGKRIMGAESGESSEEEEEEEEEESESSESGYDSEIERIIAEKSGKKGKGKVSRTEEEEGEKRKKRGRSRKRSSRRRGSSGSDEEYEGRRRRGRKKRKEKTRRRDDDSLDEEEEERRRRKRKSRQEKRRRRSHGHSSEDSSEDSADRQHKRRARRAASLSDSDVAGSDDFRVGRDKKRSEKNSRKHHHGED